MSEPAFLDFKKATVKIKDGAGTPNEMEVILGEGTMSYTETTELIYRLSRGALNTVREGDEQPVELSLQADLISVTAISGASEPTLLEALKKKGAASAWVSTGANCEPYAVDIEVVLDYDTDCPGTHGETFVFPQFRSTTRTVNLVDGTVDIQGSCNVTTIESTRQAPA